jgi:hypothetical protein
VNHIPLPRRTAGRAADGRPWELLSDDTSVTAVLPSGTVAESHVSESDERVVVEFWAEPADLPRELGEALVARTFSLPAVRPRRPVVVCIPQRQGTVLAQARRFVADARVRSAGVTCLLEGRVGDGGGTAPGGMNRRAPSVI